MCVSVCCNCGRVTKVEPRAKVGDEGSESNKRWGRGKPGKSKPAAQPTKRIIIERIAYDTAQQIVKQGGQQTDKQTDGWTDERADALTEGVRWRERDTAKPSLSTCYLYAMWCPLEVWLVSTRG